jgi:hypothetical protein
MHMLRTRLSPLRDIALLDAGTMIPASVRDETVSAERRQSKAGIRDAE